MTTVGMIGLGAMGSAMSANLLEAGLAVLGHDIDPARVEALTGRGGAAAGSVREVAERADVLLTSLPSVGAVDAVLAQPDGVLAAGRSGLTVIETSTMPLDVKERARDALAAGGVTLLDCPLSGTGGQAVTKDVIVYASGDRAAVEACVPVFDGFARAHYYLGDFGSGSKMKYIANLLVAIHNVSAAEAFTLGRKAGLDPDAILACVSDGAGSSRMFEVRGPMMISGEYDTGIKTSVFHKDLQIIGGFADSLDCPVPLFAIAAQVHSAALVQGHADHDTASVCAVLERLAGVERT